MARVGRTPQCPPVPRHPRPETQGSPRAFTLIEVLVALAILATVIAAINTVFFGALRLRATTSRIVEEAIPVNHALDVMKADLRSLRAPGGILAGSISGGLLTSSMSGGMSNSLIGIPGGIRSELPTLQFCTTTGIMDDSSLNNVNAAFNPSLSPVRPWPETQKVAYYLRDPIYSTNLWGKELVRAVTRNLLPVTDEFPMEQPLLDGVEYIEFLFYDGMSWLNSWDATVQSNAVPQAIKVQIAFAAENRDARLRKPPLRIVVPIVAQARTTNAASASGPGVATGAATGAVTGAATGTQGQTSGGTSARGGAGGTSTGGGTTGRGGTGTGNSNSRPPGPSGGAPGRGAATGGGR